MFVTFVLDTSGSMNQLSDGISYLDNAKNAVSLKTYLHTILIGLYIIRMNVSRIRNIILIILM